VGGRGEYVEVDARWHKHDNRLRKRVRYEVDENSDWMECMRH